MPALKDSVQSQIPFQCRKTRSASKNKAISRERLRERTVSPTPHRQQKDTQRKREGRKSGIKDKENGFPSPIKPSRSATPLKELQCSPPKKSKGDTPEAVKPDKGKCRLFLETSDDADIRKPGKENATCVIPKVTALSRKIVNEPQKSPSKIPSDEPKTPKGRCKLSADQADLTPYRKVAQCLHTSIPDSMLCREDHLKTVRNFIRHHLKTKSGGGLYISGAPGTGKTTCVMKVLDDIKDSTSMKFQVVFVNCMSIKHSNGIYSKMLSELTHGKYDSMTTKESEKQFLKELNKEKSIVLILDEIDQLDTKEHNILYQIFELPSLPKSQLILIGIANSLDLTDRILPRLQSMSSSRPEMIQFSPYSKDEIQKILMDRLEQNPMSESVVDSKAVQMCARKVASVAGDARKALDILRRAIEKVEAETRKQLILGPTKKDQAAIRKVSLSHIMSVVSDVYGSKFSSSNNGPAMSFPLQQKVLICTLLLLTKDNKCKEISALKLLEGYSKVCKLKQITHIGQEDFLDLCTILESRGVMNIKKSKSPLSSKVSLRLQFSEVSYALQDQTLLSSIMAINRADL